MTKEDNDLLLFSAEMSKNIYQPRLFPLLEEALKDIPDEVLLKKLNDSFKEDPNV